MNFGARRYIGWLCLGMLVLGMEAWGAPRYSELAEHYSLEAPKGFVEFCAANNNPKPNTCAIRLSAALYKVDKKFFDGVEFPAGYGWKPIDADRELATRAVSLSKIITKNWGEAKLIQERSEIAGKRGVLFFDTITGSKVTGHVSLWDGEKVVDAGDYFGKSARVHFWALE